LRDSLPTLVSPFPKNFKCLIPEQTLIGKNVSLADSSIDMNQPLFENVHGAGHVGAAPQSPSRSRPSKPKARTSKSSVTRSLATTKKHKNGTEHASTETPEETKKRKGGNQEIKVYSSSETPEERKKQKEHKREKRERKELTKIPKEREQKREKEERKDHASPETPEEREMRKEEKKGRRKERRERELEEKNELIRRLNKSNAARQDLKMKLIKAEKQLEYATEENNDFSARVHAWEHAWIVQEADIENDLCVRRKNQARREHELLEAEQKTNLVVCDQVDEQIAHCDALAAVCAELKELHRAVESIQLAELRAEADEARDQLRERQALTEQLKSTRQPSSSSSAEGLRRTFSWESKKGDDKSCMSIHDRDIENALYVVRRKNQARLEHELVEAEQKTNPFACDQVDEQIANCDELAAVRADLEELPQERDRAVESIQPVELWAEADEARDQLTERQALTEQLKSSRQLSSSSSAEGLKCTFSWGSKKGDDKSCMSIRDRDDDGNDTTEDSTSVSSGEWAHSDQHIPDGEYRVAQRPDGTSWVLTW
jgi:hypothetical protein